MSPHLDVIDAFVDGERVDPNELKSALADAEGRDYFVSVWALREVAQQERASSIGIASPVVIPVPRRSARSLSPLRQVLVAAALVVCAAGGYVVGHRSSSTSSPAVQEATIAATPDPPVPVRTVFPAPAPTRVIHLEFQPDAPTSGGN